MGSLHFPIIVTIALSTPPIPRPTRGGLGVFCSLLNPPEFRRVLGPQSNTNDNAEASRSLHRAPDAVRACSTGINTL